MSASEIEKYYFNHNRMKSTAISRTSAFQKDIATHICETYDKFSKFVRFLPLSIKSELPEYLFPVFLHIYMQLITTNRNHSAYEFYTLFSNQFFAKSKVEATKDLLRFKSYKDAVTHPYIKLFGFSSQKYVIKILRHSHELLTEWLKKNKCKFIKEIITINISADIYEESIEKGKHLEHHLRILDEDQNEPEVTGIDLRNTDGAECYNYLSSFSGNLVSSEPSGNHGETLELIGNIINNSTTSQPNRPETGSLHKQFIPERKSAVAPRLLFSPTKDQNFPKVFLSCSKRAQEPENSVSVSTLSPQSQKSTLQLYNGSQLKPESTEETPRTIPEVCLLSAKGCSGMLTCADIAEDGSFIFGGFENDVRAWDMQYKLHEKLTHYQIYAGDDEEKCGSALNTRIHAVEKAIVFRGHTGIVNGISYSRGKELLLSCSEDSTIRVWSLKNYECMREYSFHREAVISVCNSPAMVYFASASADWTAAIWNYEYGKPLLQYTKHKGEVTCIKFHPNSRYVATASDDNTIQMWETTDGNLIRLFSGHKGKITCVSFSPCGNYLTSADIDGYLKIWDINSGQCINSFLVHQGTITSVSYNDLGTLAVGGFNGCLKIFDLQKLGIPVSEKEENTKFFESYKNSFRGYHHKSPLDLVLDYPCHEKDVFGVSFIKNHLLIGMADCLPIK